MGQRRHDIDWLRVLATYLLFVFHPGLIFSYPQYRPIRNFVGIGADAGYVHLVDMPLFFHYPPYYHLKNGELSVGISILIGLIHQFHMPLFFVLAGWSLATSFSLRGMAGIVRERVLRLLVPFVFGCAIICPPIRFFEFKMEGGLGLGFLGFLPPFFVRIDWFTWSHLWFLIYLFVFSLLYLPVLIFLSRKKLKAPVPNAAIYLGIVPLALVLITLGGRWPGYQNLVDDWALFVYYSLFFIYGVILSLNPPLERAVQAQWKRAGVIGLGAAALMLSGPGTASKPLNWVTGQSLAAIAGFCLVVLVWGLAARFLAFSNRTLRYLNESTLPVYILHHLPVIAFAYLIVQMRCGIGVKFLLLMTSSLATTMVIYHFTIRPSPTLRFLFGAKPAPSRAENTILPLAPSLAARRD
jgi:glucan biosynthesis protein C